MITQANKYSAAHTEAGGAHSPASASANIFVPRLGKEIRFDEWYWKELREGGFLRRYIERDKHDADRRYRRTAQQVHGQGKQNNRSDLRRIADVPLRDYLRWKATDKHFWEDNSNLKSLKRDNPDAQIYV